MFVNRQFCLQKFDFGTHVTNSLYAVFISDWLRLFPREQFLFLRMEDYMEDRVPHIREIVSFLEFGNIRIEVSLNIVRQMGEAFSKGIGFPWEIKQQ